MTLSFGDVSWNFGTAKRFLFVTKSTQSVLIGLVCDQYTP